jgi:hypothetical protein
VYICSRFVFIENTDIVSFYGNIRCSYVKHLVLDSFSNGFIYFNCWAGFIMFIGLSGALLMLSPWTENVSSRIHHASCSYLHILVSFQHLFAFINI